MKALALSSAEIRELLNLNDLRNEMRAALISISSAETKNFVRKVFHLYASNAFGIMPAVNESRRLLGYKAVGVFPENNLSGHNPHQGMVVLLQFDTGEIKVIAEGSTITALRTAAVSALATEILSRPDSKVLSIIGSGVQAEEHIRALLPIRNFKKVKVYGRSIEKIKRLCASFAHERNISFESYTDPRSALEEADVVVSCSASSEALFSSDDLRPGTHVNAFGACRPGYQEIQIQAQSNIRIFLDHQESCISEADEIYRPLHGQKLGHLIAGELGAVLSNRLMGRENENQITIFKSVGLAVEDLFAVDLAYRQYLNNKMSTRSEQAL